MQQLEFLEEDFLKLHHVSHCHKYTYYKFLDYMNDLFFEWKSKLCFITLIDADMNFQIHTLCWKRLIILFFILLY
jgi:hypothetical protein